MFLVGIALEGAVPLAGCDSTRKDRDGCQHQPPSPQLTPEATAGTDLWKIEARRPDGSRRVLELLQHQSPAVRRRAALAAGRIGVASVLREAMQLLTDGDPSVRSAAAWAAGLADWSRAEEKLLVRLAVDQDLGMQLMALRSLGLVGGTQTVQALLRLIRDPLAEVRLRAQAFISLALLARRGSTASVSAMAVALETLLGSQRQLAERRAAAHLLATLFQRFSLARSGVSIGLRGRLRKLHHKARDPELAVSVARIAVRLKLLPKALLAQVVGQGGAAGRDAVASLVERDATQGKVLDPLLTKLIEKLPQSACVNRDPVALWQLLDHLAQGDRGPWLGRRAVAWYQAIRAWQRAAKAGSCQAHQLSRLTCLAARLADQATGRLERLPGCGGSVLTPDQVDVFVAQALGSGRLGRNTRKHLERLYGRGKRRARVAALQAASRLRGGQAHGLVSLGLRSPDLAIFSAAAEACGKLLGPLVTGRQSCLHVAREQLLLLKRPPGFRDLPRWIELVRLMRGIADNAVVAQLRAAASHHNPTLRALAAAALEPVVGRRPPRAAWPPDHRPLPAAPLRTAVNVRVHTPAGAMTLRLRPDWAPVSAAYFLGLVQRGVMNKSTFHRVVPGFVVQGGDRSETGFGGDTGLLLSECGTVRFRRGVVGLAHAGKDTEGSQFFITLGPAPHLDGRYTAIGEITAGLELADRLLPGAPVRVTRTVKARTP